MNRSERHRQKTESERQAVTPGEIKVSHTGDVVIGAPTATAIVVPIRDGEED